MSAAEERTRNDGIDCRCHEHPDIHLPDDHDRTLLAREQVRRGEIVWDELPPPEEPQR